LVIDPSLDEDGPAVRAIVEQMVNQVITSMMDEKLGLPSCVGVDHASFEKESIDFWYSCSNEGH
jgi:hypothetical protein